MSASSSAPVSSRIGEVIETSTAGYWAESDHLHQMPELGELVKVELPDGSTAYGIATFGQTGGLDPSRKAVRRGSADVSDAEIYNRHPELDHVLRTIFRVTAVGYSRGEQVRHTLPPLPVPLHYSVHSCDSAEVSRFCRTPNYFPAVLNYRGEISAEDVLAAHLRWAADCLGDSEQKWLKDASRRVARLMKRDYDRLVTLLESIDPIRD